MDKSLSLGDLIKAELGYNAVNQLNKQLQQELSETTTTLSEAIYFEGNPDIIKRCIYYIDKQSKDMGEFLTTTKNTTYRLRQYYIIRPIEKKNEAYLRKKLLNNGCYYPAPTYSSNKNPDLHIKGEIDVTGGRIHRNTTYYTPKQIASNPGVPSERPIEYGGEILRKPSVGSDTTRDKKPNTGLYDKTNASDYYKPGGIES